MEFVECACGCKGLRPKYDKKGRERKYIFAHSPKGMEGKIPWNKDKKGIMPEPWNKGKIGVMPEPWNKGLKTGPLSKEHCKKISNSNIGINEGEKNGNWKGGLTPEDEKIRYCIEYKEWRKAVFEDDNYICRVCGDPRGGNLNAHHINNFTGYKEHRFKVWNGITLCEQCHKNTHTALAILRNPDPWPKNDNKPF